MPTAKSCGSKIVHATHPLAGYRTPICGTRIEDINLKENPRAASRGRWFGARGTIQRLARVTCKRCLAMEAQETREQIKLDAQQDSVHWSISPDIIRACKSLVGDYTNTTGLIDCSDCMAVPGFREAKAKEVRDNTRHMIGFPCGAEETGSAANALSWVNCLACLESVESPAIDGPPKRRILLDGND